MSRYKIPRCELENMYITYCELTAELKRYPTIRELLGFWGYASTSGVSHVLNRLVDVGFLEKEPGRPGGYRIIGLEIQLPRKYYATKGISYQEESDGLQPS